MNDEDKVTYFAQTDSRNKRVPFGIKRKDRSRHMYVIGKTGMGKSTMLENMAIQDIRNGEGLAFIDPHGQTAELLLDYVPQERIKDVLYFAPFDMEHPISFNVMEDIGADKRHLVVNGLMSTFEKIWVDAWSARMAYILSNTLLALLEFPGSTLLGINRMLADKEYRKAVVNNVSDPSVRAFWVDEFAKYTERFAAEATPAIQNKVGQFTSNPLVRNIIGQPKSSFDFREMMDKKKITIINLSKGRVGEGNANLIGSMLITKIYLAAMSRAELTKKQVSTLPNFYLYVDEFQSFANKSFADILSEARKYNLSLNIAHQYIEQMEEEVAAAVFGNVGTMTCFRVGARDAEVLEKEFSPQFMATDLVNLGARQIYLKLMIDGVSSQPFSATTLPPLALPPVSYREQIITNSRSVFARPRSIVEAEIRAWHQSLKPESLVAKEILQKEHREQINQKSQSYTDAHSPNSSSAFSAQRPITQGTQGHSSTSHPTSQPVFSQTPHPSQSKVDNVDHKTFESKIVEPKIAEPGNGGHVSSKEHKPFKILKDLVSEGQKELSVTLDHLKTKTADYSSHGAVAGAVTNNISHVSQEKNRSALRQALAQVIGNTQTVDTNVATKDQVKKEENLRKDSVLPGEQKGGQKREQKGIEKKTQTQGPDGDKKEPSKEYREMPKKVNVSDQQGSVPKVPEVPEVPEEQLRTILNDSNEKIRNKK